MIDLSCRDNPKTQKGCATGFCKEGCPNKMGYTVRTENYRYTAWVAFNKCSNATCECTHSNDPPQPSRHV